MLITKADGTQEPFKPQKLRNSLRRAGARKEEVSDIVARIQKTLTEGMQTQAIYRKAFEMLRESTQPAAAKYSLRRALFGLGPTGFPFEDFLSELYTREGYTTRTRLTIKGKCVPHEIDLAAYTTAHSFVAEAKFHMRPGIKSDLQTVLYSYARYLDLKTHPVCNEDSCGINDLVIVTNTKFTRSAIRYAECTGLKLLSWNYPKKDHLQHRIEAAGIYPVTVLSELSSKKKQILIEAGVILCRDLVADPEKLKVTGISGKRMHAVIEEARQLCDD